MTHQRLGADVALLANPIVLVVVALAALAAGLVIAYLKVEAFRKPSTRPSTGSSATGRCCWASSPARSASPSC